MRGLWLILIAWLPLAGAAPEPKLGTARVTVRMAPDGALASVLLDREVTSFDFADADVIRDGDFELLTAGLTLAKDKVTGGRPFRRFDLRIRPMKQERDAKYPAHFRIGTGGVVYAPALKGDPKRWRTRFSFSTGPGGVRLPAGPAADGFVFIGPKALRSEAGGITVVADPAAPKWLVERSRTALAAAVSTYTEALALPLRRRPLLIVKHAAAARSFNVGDVTPGPVTALRFHGASWLREDAQAAKNIQGFMLHEAFHFWNGGLASHALGTPTWLHEGGAEYAAVLAGLKEGLLTEEEAARGLTNALQRCRIAVQASGDKALDSFAFLPAQLRYPCGMAIQWAADLHMRSASGGKRTVLDAWGETIAGARRREERSYSLADFYAAAGIASSEKLEPIRLLVRESGPARWEALPAALNAIGAEVAQVPSPAGRRAALLFHVLAQNCRNLPAGQGYGFYTDERTVKLDAPEQCGVLAGDPVVKSIEGGDPFDMPLETYAAVQRKCAAGVPVAFVTDKGRRIEAPCAAPLADPPQDFLVKRWRP